jgi:transposase
MNRFPEPNSVLVLGNAQIHHNGRIASIVEAKGALIQYLPPYSPDLNPIEKGFSVYKSNLRRYEDLLTGGEDDYEVIDGFIPLVFTGEITRELFRGSGYSVE